MRLKSLIKPWCWSIFVSNVSCLTLIPEASLKDKDLRLAQRELLSSLFTMMCEDILLNKRWLMLNLLGVWGASNMSYLILPLRMTRLLMARCNGVFLLLSLDAKESKTN